MSALALAAVVFGLHSAIDWTWFVPGSAVLGIAIAGYVAGRGPAPRPAGSPSPVVTGGPPIQPVIDIPRLPRIRLRLPAPPRAARLVPALGVLLLVACSAWAVWQPDRADGQSQQALSLAGQKRFADAARAADRAHSIDPASIRPLWVKAAVEIAAGKLSQAETLFQTAVFDQPSNPEPWTRLAEFELYRMHNPKRALSTIDGALFLDPRSPSAQTVFFDARVALRKGA
jgi:tetratricopeptide (TPR) repeat protein